jgi:hypothetical protein
MKSLLKIIPMIVALAATNAAQAGFMSFDIQETDVANPTPHVHHVALEFNFDLNYGTDGVDTNGFSLIDYETVVGTLTVPNAGVEDEPNTVLDVIGLAPGDFEGLSGQFNDNLFKYPEPGSLDPVYFSENGFAFESTDGSHSYMVFQRSPAVGCATGCTTILPVTNFSVPEPSSIALFSLSLVGLAFRRNKPACRLG